MALTAVLVLMVGLSSATGNGAERIAVPDQSAGFSNQASQLLGQPAPLRTASGGQPNVVLITTDDQTTDELEFMPRTRQLFGELGVEFTNSISPHPLCCPARAEILTGAYAQNNGVRHNEGPFGGYPAFLKNHQHRHLGTWLQRAGYRTGFVGKMMNGYPDRVSDPAQLDLPGWDRWDPIAGRIYDYFSPIFYNDGDPEAIDGYVTDVLAQRASRFVSERAGEDPFFLWVSHVAPHAARGPATTDYYGEDKWGPALPAPRHEGLFADERPPSLDKPSFNEPDVSDKPREVQGKGRVSRSLIEDKWQQRLRSLQAVDEANAALLQSVRRNGEIDNTIFIFTSDNGFLFGEHRLREKNRQYTESLEVPLLIRGPGLQLGGTSDSLASTVDLTATILDAAGAEPRPAAVPVDGASLLPAARGENADGLSEVNLIQGGTDVPAELEAGGWAWRGVYSSRYTLTRHASGEWELYDRERDPFELENLVTLEGELSDPAYAETLKALRYQWLQLTECSGAACEPANAEIPDPV